MILVLLGISIILFIIIFIFVDDYEDITISFAPLMGFIIKLGVVIWLAIKVTNLSVIDNKIKLYTNQNKEIERKVENAVRQYMEHENKTFNELKTGESYITLVTLYPELKSDDLIKEEINLYEENNKKIISLKEDKINGKLYKWWLYFGK